MQFRQLAKEADVLTQRVSQDSYFEYVADPSPMEQLLESMTLHLPLHSLYVSPLFPLSPLPSFSLLFLLLK